jgi:hypothetical protein
MGQRLHEIARKYDMTLREMANKLTDMGYPTKAHHFSCVPDKAIEAVRVAMSNVTSQPVTTKKIIHANLHAASKALGLTNKDTCELFKRAGCGHIKAHPFQPITIADIDRLKSFIVKALDTI